MKNANNKRGTGNAVPPSVLKDIKTTVNKDQELKHLFGNEHIGIITSAQIKNNQFKFGLIQSPGLPEVRIHSKNLPIYGGDEAIGVDVLSEIYAKDIHAMPQVKFRVQEYEENNNKFLTAIHVTLVSENTVLPSLIGALKGQTEELDFINMADFRGAVIPHLGKEDPVGETIKHLEIEVVGLMTSSNGIPEGFIVRTEVSRTKTPPPKIEEKTPKVDLKKSPLINIKFK